MPRMTETSSSNAKTRTSIPHASIKKEFNTEEEFNRKEGLLQEKCYDWVTYLVGTYQRYTLKAVRAFCVVCPYGSRHL